MQLLEAATLASRGAVTWSFDQAPRSLPPVPPSHHSKPHRYVCSAAKTTNAHVNPAADDGGSGRAPATSLQEGICLAARPALRPSLIGPRATTYSRSLLPGPLTLRRQTVRQLLTGPPGSAIHAVHNKSRRPPPTYTRRRRTSCPPIHRRAARRSWSRVGGGQQGMWPALANCPRPTRARLLAREGITIGLKEREGPGFCKTEWWAEWQCDTGLKLSDAKKYQRSK